MKLLKLTVCTTFLLAQMAIAQSANYRAQGYYYKAKELYESRNYSSSLDYIEKAKSSLNGTNYKLQYLHIINLVAKEDWVNANREMERYFNVIDRIEQPIGFEKIVEKLTLDETKDLTKLMVDIEENANYSNSKESQMITLFQEVFEPHWIGKGYFARSGDSEYSYSIKASMVVISHKDYNSKNDDDCIFGAEIYFDISDIKLVKTENAEEGIAYFNFKDGANSLSGTTYSKNCPMSKDNFITEISERVFSYKWVSLKYKSRNGVEKFNQLISN